MHNQLPFTITRAGGSGGQHFVLTFLASVSATTVVDLIWHLAQDQFQLILNCNDLVQVASCLDETEDS